MRTFKTSVKTSPGRRFVSSLCDWRVHLTCFSSSLRRPDCKEARWPLLPRQRLWRKRRSGCCGGATLCWRGWSTTAREPCHSWAARVTVPVPKVPAGTFARRATAVGRPAAALITTNCGVSATYIYTSHRFDPAHHHRLPDGACIFSERPPSWNTNAPEMHSALRGTIRQCINEYNMEIIFRTRFNMNQPTQILSLYSFFEIPRKIIEWHIFVTCSGLF